MMIMMQILPALLRTSIEDKGGSPLGVLLGFLFCFTLFAFSLYKMIQDYRLCTEPVEALCVDLKMRRGRKRRMVFAPVWEYTYQGRYVRVVSNTASNTVVPQVGKTYTLYVNPEDPERFRTRVSNWLPFVIVSGLFMMMIVGIVVL